MVMSSALRYGSSLLFSLLLTLLLGLSGAVAQEGHGVAVLLDDSREALSGYDALNCRSLDCARYLNLMFPTIFPFDPLTGGAAAQAVIPDLPPLPESIETYSLADGLTWSDGSPITAYDVAYSLLSRQSLVAESLSPLAGLRIDSASQLTLSYVDADCAVHSRVNGMVIPVEQYNLDFRRFADDFMAQTQDDLPAPSAWRDAYREWSERAAWFSPVTDSDMLVTGGPFTVTLRSIVLDPLQSAYLARGDLVLTSPGGSNLSMVQRFLTGEVNLLLNPSLERWADLQATPGLQFYEAPGFAVDYLVFNQSDPFYPRDAFVDGEPLEQLPHPVFADLRVRQAVQLAIDVPTLIDSALYGHATALNGAYPPTSWAYDPTLPAPKYDPAAAQRLLDDAGWRDIDGDNIRDCYGCMYAHPGADLSVALAIDDQSQRGRAAEILRTQLQRVGINVVVTTDDQGGARQDFDMVLTGSYMTQDPDFYRQFARGWDRLGVAEGNIGSVDNPQLEALLDEARKVPACDRAERAALYSEVQALLRDEVPAIWLYARHDLYVARDIAGFAPQPGAPFWNIENWVVAR